MASRELQGSKVEEDGESADQSMDMDEQKAHNALITMDSLAWMREIWNGFFTYDGQQRPIPMFMVEMCARFARDVPRVLILLVFIMQVVMFEQTMRIYQASNPGALATRLVPFWVMSVSAPMVIFLLLLLKPSVFASIYTILFETYWQRGAIRLLTPVCGSSTFGMYMASHGKAFIPFFAAWLVYVIFMLLPRLWFFMFATTTHSFGVIVPGGFLVYSFVINLCLNVGYLQDSSLVGNNDPIRFFFTILSGSQGSIMSILDAESILNEIGASQTFLPLTMYMPIAFVVLVAVSLELLLLTLEISMLQGDLWKYGTMREMILDKSKGGWRSRYGRTALLLFLSFILLENSFEVVKLVVRIVLATRQHGTISTFVYKNIFTLLVQGSQAFSLMLLLVSPKTVISD